MTTPMLNSRRNLSDVEDRRTSFNNVVQHPTTEFADWDVFRSAASSVSIVEFSHARNSQGNFQQQINRILGFNRFASGNTDESRIIAPSIRATSFTINGVALRSSSVQPWTGGSPLNYGGNVKTGNFICNGVLLTNSQFIESSGATTRGIRVILNTLSGKKYFIVRLDQA